MNEIDGTPPLLTEHDAWVEAHGHPYTEKWFPYMDREIQPDGRAKDAA